MTLRARKDRPKCAGQFISERIGIPLSFVLVVIAALGGFCAWVFRQKPDV